MSTSATGGYTKPSFTEPNPKNLTLTQFIQTMFVGLTGLPGPMVRPKWQEKPPQAPDVGVNWLAYGIASSAADFNAYLGMNTDDQAVLQRQEQLEVQVSIYGPDALDLVEVIRDGFQIPQNQAGMLSARMGLVEVTKALHIPELINERFFNRYEMAVVLNRQVQREYPILYFLSAAGTIYTQTAENTNFTLPIIVANE